MYDICIHILYINKNLNLLRKLFINCNSEILLVIPIANKNLVLLLFRVHVFHWRLLRFQSQMLKKFTSHLYKSGCSLAYTTKTNAEINLFCWNQITLINYRAWFHSFMYCSIILFSYLLTFWINIANPNLQNKSILEPICKFLYIGVSTQTFILFNFNFVIYRSSLSYNYTIFHLYSLNIYYVAVNYPGPGNLKMNKPEKISDCRKPTFL